MDNYIFHTFYVNRIESGRILDTVEFTPEHNKIQRIYNQEEATNEALYLIEAIYNTYLTSPFVSIGYDKPQYIRKLEDILKQNTTSKKPPQGDRTN